MSKEMWLNLPSKDLIKAKDFFVKLGFDIDTEHSGPHMVSLRVGSNKVIVNLFAESLFQQFIGGQKITDAVASNEILFSVGASSPQEVDELAKKAVDAGGVLYGKPGYKDGWMYGCGFVDLDGHRWNILYMDFSKLNK